MPEKKGLVGGTSKSDEDGSFSSRMKSTLLAFVSSFEKKRKSFFDFTRHSEKKKSENQNLQENNIKIENDARLCTDIFNLNYKKEQIISNSDAKSEKFSLFETEKHKIIDKKPHKNTSIKSKLSIDKTLGFLEKEQKYNENSAEDLFLSFDSSFEEFQEVKSSLSFYPCEASLNSINHSGHFLNDKSDSSLIKLPEICNKKQNKAVKTKIYENKLHKNEPYCLEPSVAKKYIGDDYIKNISNDDKRNHHTLENDILKGWDERNLVQNGFNLPEGEYNSEIQGSERFNCSDIKLLDNKNKLNEGKTTHNCLINPQTFFEDKFEIYETVKVDSNKYRDDYSFNKANTTQDNISSKKGLSFNTNKNFIKNIMFRADERQFFSNENTSNQGFIRDYQRKKDQTYGLKYKNERELHSPFVDSKMDKYMKKQSNFSQEDKTRIKPNSKIKNYEDFTVKKQPFLQKNDSKMNVFSVDKFKLEQEKENSLGYSQLNEHKNDRILLQKDEFLRNFFNTDLTDRENPYHFQPETNCLMPDDEEIDSKIDVLQLSSLTLSLIDDLTGIMKNLSTTEENGEKTKRLNECLSNFLQGEKGDFEGENKQIIPDIEENNTNDHVFDQETLKENKSIKNLLSCYFKVLGSCDNLRRYQKRLEEKLFRSSESLQNQYLTDLNIHEQKLIRSSSKNDTQNIFHENRKINKDFIRKKRFNPLIIKTSNKYTEPNSCEILLRKVDEKTYSYEKDNIVFNTTDKLGSGQFERDDKVQNKVNNADCQNFQFVAQKSATLNDEKLTEVFMEKCKISRNSLETFCKQQSEDFDEFSDISSEFSNDLELKEDVIRDIIECYSKTLQKNKSIQLSNSPQKFKENHLKTYDFVPDLTQNSKKDNILLKKYSFSEYDDKNYQYSEFEKRMLIYKRNLRSKLKNKTKYTPQDSKKSSNLNIDVKSRKSNNLKDYNNFQKNYMHHSTVLDPFGLEICKKYSQNKQKGKIRGNENIKNEDFEDLILNKKILSLKDNFQHFVSQNLPKTKLENNIGGVTKNNNEIDSKKKKGRKKQIFNNNTYLSGIEEENNKETASQKNSKKEIFFNNSYLSGIEEENNKELKFQKNSKKEIFKNNTYLYGIEEEDNKESTSQKNLIKERAKQIFEIEPRERLSPKNMLYSFSQISEEENSDNFFNIKEKFKYKYLDKKNNHFIFSTKTGQNYTNSLNKYSQKNNIMNINICGHSLYKNTPIYTFYYKSSNKQSKIDHYTYKYPLFLPKSLKKIENQIKDKNKHIFKRSHSLNFFSIDKSHLGGNFLENSYFERSKSISHSLFPYSMKYYKFENSMKGIIINNSLKLSGKNEQLNVNYEILNQNYNTVQNVSTIQEEVNIYKSKIGGIKYDKTCNQKLKEQFSNSTCYKNPVINNNYEDKNLITSESENDKNYIKLPKNEYLKLIQHIKNMEKIIYEKEQKET